MSAHPSTLSPMWTDLGDWFRSVAAAPALQAALIPAVAILLAGVIAGLIARAAVRSAVARADRDQTASVVAGLVEAARLVTERDTDGKEHRRATRLRTESDVRMRLLPVQGAALAADWASLRLDALQRPGADQPSSGDFDDFRDRLVAWTLRPRRARALFEKDVDRWRAARDGRRAAADGDGPSAVAEPRAELAERPIPVEPAVAVAVPSRVARAAGRGKKRPGSDGAAAIEQTETDAGVIGAERSEASEAVSATPAWRRARAAADVREVQGPQQGDAQQAAIPGDAEAEAEPEEQPVPTAPVAVQSAHRAAGAPAADADEAVRAEAQQIARHGRSGDGAEAAASAPTPVGQAAPATTAIPSTRSSSIQSPSTQSAPAAPPPASAAVAFTSAAGTEPSPRGPATSAAPVAAPAPGLVRPAPGAPTPAWVDTYDDEAEVTQTMNLKTPPPVAAMSVRDRNRSGDDIVPRQ